MLTAFGKTVTISGFMRDASNGATLIGANIYDITITKQQLNKILQTVTIDNLFHDPIDTLWIK